MAVVSLAGGYINISRVGLEKLLKALVPHIRLLRQELDSPEPQNWS